MAIHALEPKMSRNKPHTPRAPTHQGRGCRCPEAQLGSKARQTVVLQGLGKMRPDTQSPILHQLPGLMEGGACISPWERGAQRVVELPGETPGHRPLPGSLPCTPPPSLVSGLASFLRMRELGVGAPGRPSTISA